MSYREFRRWADEKRLNQAERDEMILEASHRGMDIANMGEEDWERLAEEIGVILGYVQRFWRWVKGIF